MCPEGPVNKGPLWRSVEDTIDFLATGAFQDVHIRNNGKNPKLCSQEQTKNGIINKFPSNKKQIKTTLCLT